MELQGLACPSRASALRYASLFSTPAQPGLDRLTRLAARALDAPLASIHLVDGDRELCRSISDRSGPRDAGAADLLGLGVIRSGSPLVVADAREHPLLRSLPAVQAARTAALLGVPLVPSDGSALGIFCVVDQRPRAWTEEEVSSLEDLAASVVTELELRADVVMRQAAEQELETTSNRLRVVLEASTIGIALVDRAGYPVEVNPALARMLGYSADELLGMTFPEFTHPDDAGLDSHLFAEVTRGERTHYQIEKRYLRRDGEVLWGRLTVSAARDEQGNTLILLGMVEDLTEHREVQTLQTRLRVLEGMLPICMFCKGIRNEDDDWEQLENYISRHSEATFTHGCCPTCIEEHFTQYAF